MSKQIVGLDKMKQARARLMLAQPFFGSASLNLALKEDATAPTAWTDGKTLGFNPAFTDTLSIKQVEGLICHEILHCIMFHPTRKGKRDHRTFNMAGDYVINAKLKAIGYDLSPMGWLYDSKYNNLNTEQVYGILAADQKAEQDKKAAENQKQIEQGKKDPGQAHEDTPESTNGNDADPESTTENKNEQSGDSGSDEQDGTDGQGNAPGEEGKGKQPGIPDPGMANSGADNGSPDGSGGNPSAPDDSWNVGECRDGATSEAEAKQLEQDWKREMIRAANMARGAGNMPGFVERMTAEAIVTRKDIEEGLRDFVEVAISNDYSWKRPNKTYMIHDLYVPSMYSDVLPDIVMVLDTSGSVSSNQIDYFAAKVNSVMQEFRSRVHVIYCDTEAYYDQDYGPEDLPVKLQPKGFGGTNFKPPFKMLDDMGITPACLIYLTDLECWDWPEDPGYPVLWAVYGADRSQNYKAPFGEVIDVNPNN